MEISGVFVLTFAFLLLPSSEVFSFAATLSTAAKYREHDQQHETDEDDDDADFNGSDQKADERDKLAQERDDEQDDRYDSTPATERFKKSRHDLLPLIAKSTGN